MVCGRKIRLLVWKNWLLRKRHCIVTSLEILLPTLLALQTFGSFYMMGRNGGGVRGSHGHDGTTKINRFPEQPDGYFKMPPCDGGWNSRCLIAYTPQETWTNDIIDLLRKKFPPDIEWKGFKKEIEIEKLANFNPTNSGPDSPEIVAALIFETDLKNDVVSYKIRIVQKNPYFIPGTMMNLFAPNNNNDYEKTGFTALQIELDKVLIQRLTKEPACTLSLQGLPYPSFDSTDESVMELIITPFIVVGFIFLVPTVIRVVVSERETGIKELLKMSGIPSWMNYFALMINSMLFLSISITIIVLLYFIGGETSGVLYFCDASILWIMLFLYIMASTSFCFFVSSFFQKPVIAIIVGLILWLVTYFGPAFTLGESNNYFNLSLIEKLSAALLPNMAIVWAIKVIYFYENRGIGAHWDNLFEPLSTIDSLSLGWVFVLFIIDTVLYLLLAMYVEAVLPNQFGVRRPWYFVFETCISSIKNLTNRGTNKGQLKITNVVVLKTGSPNDNPEEKLEPQDIKSKVEGVDEEHAESKKLPETVPPMTVKPESVPPTESIVKVEDLQPGIEAEPEGLLAGVEIKNLEKKFGRNKVAVGGVSMKMYQGEIFALLGHNGAGKTTTISCCIGMMKSSSGTAIINGFDITTHPCKVRQSIGLCPQHNLLFDELTVDEHLRFFGRLKGISSKAAKNERFEILQKLQLSDKAKTMSKALSGGQKRKLSLGIALIGNAKVVFLDEPTSGMDVEARRAIWDLLLFERSQRTICLTTHFMEEADVLGDRIGIMSNGKLQCCGTSTFLKKYYGTGYTLSLTTSGQGNHDKILSVVQSHVSTASKDSANNNQICILLPTESCSTGVFPSLFKDLQSKKEALGIQSIGLSATTMDEVFVKAEGTFLYKSEVETKANDLTDLTSPSEYSAMGKHGTSTTKIDNPPAADNMSLKNKETGKSDAAIEPQTENPETDEKSPVTETGLNSTIIVQNNDSSLAHRRTGLRLFFNQFIGLMIKRITYSWRKRTILIAQVLLPILLLIFAILCGNAVLPSHSPPIALKIEMGMYSNAIPMYSTKDSALGNSFKSVVGSSASEFTDKNNIGLENELLRIGQTDTSSYFKKYIVAAELTKSNIKAMYSKTALHSMPLTVNVATNTILNNMASRQKISVTNHPIEKTDVQQILYQVLYYGPIIGTMFMVLIPISLALLAATFIVLPIEERVCKGKQLQMMTGVNPIVYWGTSFLWDYFILTIVICLMLVCFPIFQRAQAYTSYDGAGAFFLIMFVFGFCAIPFSYLWSLYARTVSGGFSFVVIIHLLTGLVLALIVPSLSSIPNANNLGLALLHIGRFFPTFVASISIGMFVDIALKNSRCSFLPDYVEDILCTQKNKTLDNDKIVQCCKNCLKLSWNKDTCFKPVSYLSWTYERVKENRYPIIDKKILPGVGQELLYLFLVGVAYHVLLILLDYGFIEKIAGKICRTKMNLFAKYPEDEDVINESTRVNSLILEGRTNEDALLVQNFCKNYGPFAAVSNLSFGVHHGECFGLLGVNGAGKTTTFRMITGDELRSNGNAYAMMRNIEKDRKKFLADIGYCPQFDGIISVLTGREMIELFGRLRGISNVKYESNKWLEKVGLTQSGNVQCGKYSGGMKRRLSAAIAMVGDPHFVLLDEPTSGVDPISRREFWKIILSIRESGRAVILTSHSMDEITACCSRLGIMVNGQLQCLGSVPYLKNKFAQGYSLSIKLKSTFVDNGQLIILDQEIVNKFTPCFLKDKHMTALQYEISSTTLPWDFLFQTMEDLKTQFAEVIEEYSITETTLEEVFLSFARQQYPERKVNLSRWGKCLACMCCKCCCKK